jgi:hypothetical protein
MPVAQSFTLLPLEMVINHVPLFKFPRKGGSKGSKGFLEQQGVLP